MRAIKIFAVALAFCFALAFPASGQYHDRFEGWCHSLENAALPDLVQFLNGVAPHEENARCVTWAIHKLGKERYEPATTALVRLLDFHRPQSDGEKIFEGLSQELLPAEEALELVGKKALPEVLRAIEADSTSALARENALSVWMEVYRQSNEQAQGVGLLKQEEAKASDDKLKQRLAWAVQKALARCNPRDMEACREAAAGRASAQ